MKTNRELETAIENDPDDKSIRSVHADWLQANGDPRGEWIAVALAPDKGAEWGGLLIKHADQLLGPLGKYQLTFDGEKKGAFAWKYGFIHGANLSHNSYAEKLEGGLADGLKQLLSHDSGRFLAELTMTFNNDPNEDNLQSLIDVLAEAPRPAIRKLHFGDFKYAGAARDEDQGEDTEISWYSVGNLTALWPQVPKLQSLIIQTGSADSAMSGGTTLGELNLPELRHFEYRTGGLESANFDAIAAMTAPKLEHLDVWTGSDNYGCSTTLEHVEKLLARTDLPNLKHLGIMNCEFIDTVIAALAKSPLLPKLVSLDLSLGCLTTDGVAVLNAHRDAFKHLATLDVSHNYLTTDGAGMLRGLAKEIITDNQRDFDGEDRYSAVGE